MVQHTKQGTPSANTHDDSGLPQQERGVGLQGMVQLEHRPRLDGRSAGGASASGGYMYMDRPFSGQATSSKC